MSAAPKIHFVSLVSVDFDVDMLPTFIPHYAGLELDNYVLFLHEGKNTDANLWSEKAAKDAGWKCRFVPRESSFGNGELKRALVNKFQKAVKPGDFIICADGDEIQAWPFHPREVAADGFDMVLGRRTDRFNEKLVGIDHEIPIEANFPLEHDNLSKLLFPKRPRTRDKIVMAKGMIPVDYKKCIGLTTKQPGNIRVTGEVPILHYKWRDNIFRRIQERPDYYPEEVRAIHDFFK
jgi:hypothetical protein